MPFDVNDKRKRKYLYLISPRESMVSPTLTATIYVGRYPSFYLLNAFLLIFLINLIAFSVFSINFHSPHFRLATSLTILLTSISFKWVVNRALPPISRINSLDFYHIISISFVCILICWHALIGTNLFGLLDVNFSFKLDVFMAISFFIVFCIFQLIFAMTMMRGVETWNKLLAEENKFLLSYQDYIKRTLSNVSQSSGNIYSEDSQEKLIKNVIHKIHRENTIRKKSFDI